MKTTLRKLYAFTNQILMAVVAAIFGYNLCLAISQPEKANLTISIILLALTYYACKKYGYKIDSEKAGLK
ncbi:hypothetical protein [Chryseobacterium sp. MMS23-Vi53]|uniref:hypothetical protein n=1 Tax=Chryseobacterium sp. MMS23-Vi53 TaxID=3386644 RepID=UPI0039EB9706